MNNNPPFEPPYQAISAEFEKAMLEYDTSVEAAPASAITINSTRDTKAPGSVAGAKAGIFFLVVPFAEKDDAKGLGARWDAASRRWYVPLGKDLGAFKRWMPKK